MTSLFDITYNLNNGKPISTIKVWLSAEEEKIKC